MLLSVVLAVSKRCAKWEVPSPQTRPAPVLSLVTQGGHRWSRWPTVSSIHDSLSTTDVRQGLLLFG